MRISWAPPEPRSGLAGAWDKFVGPGQTTAEFWLGMIPGFLAGIAAPAYALYNQLGWSTVQLIIAALFAFDLTGGVIVNASSSAKRWYHRPGQDIKHLLGFTAVHIHPLLIAWLWRGSDWAYFGTTYGYLLLAALLILKMPLYLQRPFAMLLYLGGLLLSLYILAPTAGLEWFLPFFYLKLLVCHLLKEAPFRPESEQ